MFEGFEEFDIAWSSTTIHGRRAGAGPALLLCSTSGAPRLRGAVKVRIDVVRRHDKGSRGWLIKPTGRKRLRAADPELAQVLEPKGPEAHHQGQSGPLNA